MDIHSNLWFRGTRLRNLQAAVATDEPLRKAEAGSGSGDVAGPASASDGHVAVFDGTTGKLIKDSGLALSGTNTGDETATSLGATTHGATEVAGLIASDELGVIDTTGTPTLRRITWVNFKLSVKAYLDSIYAKLGAVTSSGLTMEAGKLLGRSTIEPGAVEEITLGTGLTLASGVLSATAEAGGGFTYAATAPTSPSPGHRWVHSDTGIEYTYINDGTSSQWVEL